eukprot:TRINITY_DN41793_c0_g1_i3.p1 TRINITY_DN41793_c0_g1~~TRINITY_DN41793_c0_g1_i3.p1  ORF type:complete len:442 (-),score=61.87 TRINITY_DN41793_c0_g1_i3:44-1369(-)
MQIKKDLLLCLESETSTQIRHQICDAIGEIGGSLLQDKQNNQWPELIPSIWALLSSNSNILIESSFKILSQLFNYASDIFIDYGEQLLEIFKCGLLSQDNSIKLTTVEAMSSFITIIDEKTSKNFDSLSQVLIEATNFLLQNDIDKGEKALQFVGDICEYESKFFQKKFQFFHDSMYAIVFSQQISQIEIKRLATENLLVFAERVPKEFRDNKNYLYSLIEMIISHMVKIEMQIEPEWEKPREGFREEGEDDTEVDTIKLGINNIDRVISYIGDSYVLPVLGQMVQKLIQQEDWRYQYSAIMTLSQVGEYMKENKELEPIMNLILAYSSDNNPKIRYAVCHCIGQIASDMKDFSLYFSGQVFPLLVKMIEDPVPRVQAHSISALNNVIEKMDALKFKAFTEQILKAIVPLLRNTISLIKDCLLYTSPSPRDRQKSRMPSSA